MFRNRWNVWLEGIWLQIYLYILHIFAEWCECWNLYQDIWPFRGFQLFSLLRIWDRCEKQILLQVETSRQILENHKFTSASKNCRVDDGRNQVHFHVVSAERVRSWIKDTFGSVVTSKKPRVASFHFVSLER